MMIVQLNLDEFASDLINLSPQQLVAKYQDPQSSNGTRIFRLEADFSLSELIQKLQVTQKVRKLLTGPPDGSDRWYLYEANNKIVVDHFENNISRKHTQFNTIDDALWYYLPRYMGTLGISFKTHIPMETRQIGLGEFFPDLISLPEKQLWAKYHEPQRDNGRPQYRLETNFTVDELVEKLKAVDKLRMFLTRPPYHGDRIYFYEQDGVFTVADYDRSISFGERQFVSIETALEYFLPMYLANLGLSFKDFELRPT